MLMPPGRLALSIPLVGQDSNLVVRRIPDDTLEILFHALTQCQRWHRLAAFTFMAATQVRLAQANHHVALATCYPPYPTPSSATRNWVRFACVICYEMDLLPYYLWSHDRSSLTLYDQERSTQLRSRHSPIVALLHRSTRVCFRSKWSPRDRCGANFYFLLSTTTLDPYPRNTKPLGAHMNQRCSE